MVQWVQEQLRLGLGVSHIMMKHKHCVKEIMNMTQELRRVIFIFDDDVQNIYGKLVEETYKMYANDAENVRMCASDNNDNAFFVQDHINSVVGGLTCGTCPLHWTFKLNGKKDMMSRHMHMKGITIDPTFGTNENKVRPNDFHVSCCII